MAFFGFFTGGGGFPLSKSRVTLCSRKVSTELLLRELNKKCREYGSVRKRSNDTFSINSAIQDSLLGDV